MATMAREAWTDERLGDLKGSVDAGFADNRAEFRAVRAEIGSESQALRAEMKSEFQAVRGEIAALSRSIHQLTVSLVGAMLLGFLGTISALVTLT
jgi:site-specific recombinase